ncbi:hypothetical protein IC229_05605 [Spirosoma sp. BT702]|uniref:Uncharacterized protein n=1 Tax=Spirosoma profusum TaxID=2771354 RepID=A0A926Y191_9BACT|nr:hypothetical protein [Spirosoma profusum]MBD2700100.1 hypothetical protein [Spirosoma profusum]
MNVPHFITLLAVPPPKSPLPVPKNQYRLFIVTLEGEELTYLQKLLDVDIQKRLFDFTDADSSRLSLDQLMWLDSLLPQPEDGFAAGANVAMSAAEFQDLLEFTASRTMLQQEVDYCLLVDIDRVTLLGVLHRLCAQFFSLPPFRPTYINFLPLP